MAYLLYLVSLPEYENNQFPAKKDPSLHQYHI